MHHEHNDALEDLGNIAQSSENVRAIHLQDNPQTAVESVPKCGRNVLFGYFLNEVGDMLALL